ncbi:MAG TPA: hypothetical protein VE997_05705 [Candidatus Limnocylindria bacterium]|jgi:hypothetical protein|nr:hypothetical protein [Candidatus Limnocylindria bacterium]
MGKIAIGIVGVRNCASSLLQGIEFHRSADAKTADAHVGLMRDDNTRMLHPELPPRQLPDDLAKERVEAFLGGEVER